MPFCDECGHPCGSAARPHESSVAATTRRRQPGGRQMIWPARMPARSRMVVPELPASRSASGRRSVPLPVTWTASDSVSRRAPSARIQAAVERTSSPSGRPVIRDTPPAREPSISARCPIDLSPGTRVAPFIEEGRTRHLKLRSPFAVLPIVSPRRRSRLRSPPRHPPRARQPLPRAA